MLARLGTDPRSGRRYLYLETPGAGGYGAPGKRAAQALADDLASGKFSAAYLKRHYGYSPGEG
jgi:N-methylhydantoinase B